MRRFPGAIRQYFVEKRRFVAGRRFQDRLGRAYGLVKLSCRKHATGKAGPVWGPDLEKLSMEDLALAVWLGSTGVRGASAVKCARIWEGGSGETCCYVTDRGHLGDGASKVLELGRAREELCDGERVGLHEVFGTQWRPEGDHYSGGAGEGVEVRQADTSAWRVRTQLEAHASAHARGKSGAGPDRGEGAPREDERHLQVGAVQQHFERIQRGLGVLQRVDLPGLRGGGMSADWGADSGKHGQKTRETGEDPEEDGGVG